MKLYNYRASIIFVFPLLLLLLLLSLLTTISVVIGQQQQQHQNRHHPQQQQTIRNQWLSSSNNQTRHHHQSVPSHSPPYPIVSSLPQNQKYQKSFTTTINDRHRRQKSSSPSSLPAQFRPSHRERQLLRFRSSTSSSTPAGLVAQQQQQQQQQKQQWRNSSSPYRPIDKGAPSPSAVDEDRLKWIQNIPSVRAVAKMGHFGGIIPIQYHLHIKAPVSYNSSVSQKHYLRFQGAVKIKFITAEMVNVIFLHSSQLTITLQRIGIRPTGTTAWEPVLNAKFSEEDDILMIRTKEMLKKNKIYELVIPEFIGDIKPGFNLGVFRGFVHQTPTKYYYVTGTQFQLDAARAAFPCVDTPYFKTNLTLTLVHPPNSMALGNMAPLAGSRTVDGGWKETRFATSPRLPTYTMGFNILPNVYRSIYGRGNQGLHLTLLYNPYKVQAILAKTLMRYVRYSLNYLQDYFDVDLPLDKIDFVLIPQFVVQGMENFGLITLNQDYLLIKKPAYRLSLIAHELTHQWFSNLVTVEGWDQICFQEGITDHFARSIVRKFFGATTPDWDNYFMEKYISGMIQETITSPPANLFLSLDTNLAQVSKRCFGKGVFVMGGLEQLVGPENFKRRVRDFVRAYAHRFYRLSDFATYFEHFYIDSKKPASEFLLYWFQTPGYPSLFVSRDYNSNQVFVKQEHIYVKPNGDQYRRLGNTWPIPLKARIKSSQWQSRIMLLNQTFHSERLPFRFSSKDWMLFNPDFGFFYRVNYDAHNWHLLGQTLASDPFALSPVSRAQVVHDFCFFYKLGLIPEANQEALKQTIVEAVYEHVRHQGEFANAFLYLIENCAKKSNPISATTIVRRRAA